MKIFLTYAAEDRNIAEQVYFALVGNKHAVFFDRASLPAGIDYNARIRQAVLDSDLLVFLISEDSVARSSYALTELAFAQNKWPHPAEVVVPVMIRKTDYDRIPNYLKAVTILEPRGNVAAEVADEVSKIGATRTHRPDMAQALSKYWPAPVALGAAAIVLGIALLGDGRVRDEDSSRDDLSRQLEEMTVKLKAMEVESALIKSDYAALKVTLAQLQPAQREDLSARLESELAMRFEDLSRAAHPSSAAHPSRIAARIEATMQDPSLTSEEKGAQMVELTTSALQELDIDIDRQAQLIDANRTSPSIDVETMKLKRLIDQRSQMFDMLRQIIDKYNQTAKGIIDSIGR